MFEAIFQFTFVVVSITITDPAFNRDLFIKNPVYLLILILQQPLAMSKTFLPLPSVCNPISIILHPITMLFAFKEISCVCNALGSS